MANDVSKSILTDWVTAYSDQLYSWAFHKTSRKEIAEDLVQETFLAAAKNLQSFKKQSEPKTWLFSILRNKIADHFRKLYRAGENKSVSMDAFFDENEGWINSAMPHEWVGMEDTNLLDNEQFNRVFGNCMQKLPENWYASIVLKYMEEKDAKEICQELGVTPSNYWQIVNRAKLQLRKCLELNWFNNE